MGIPENLKRLRERYDLSQADLGRIAGGTNKSVSAWENGTKEPRMGAIQRMADYFHIKKSDIIEDQQRHGGVHIPVLGTVIAGFPMYAAENIIGYEEIPQVMASQGDYFALKVTGHSMEPRICEGDVVIVRKQSDVESGDTAIVMVNSEEATIKHIQKTAEGITLIANNFAVYQPHFYTNKEIMARPVRILGKVVELRGKL